MARQFSCGRGGLPAPKRQIANDGFDGFGVVTMSTVALVAAGGNTASQITIPAATLVRTRGVVSVSVRSTGATVNHMQAAFGLLVVTAEAVAVGITAVPTPLSQIENDWFVWAGFAFNISNATITQESNRGIITLPIDSRGMRKLKLGDSLVAVLEVRQEDTTTGTVVDFAYALRQQFKL